MQFLENMPHSTASFHFIAPSTCYNSNAIIIIIIIIIKPTIFACTSYDF